MRRPLALTAVALSSASGLAFEIALTRVFAITQFYHFAFMTVSLALLGFGASGAVLVAVPRLAQGGPQRLAWLAACQSITTIGAYGITNALPFDSFSIAWDTRQMIYLAVYYLALAVPFFFGGTIAAALLSSGAWPAHHVYAANLVGSGAGCLLALAGLAWLGGTGVIVAAALLATLAAIGFAWTTTRNPFRAGVIGLAVVLLIAMLHPPDALALRLSPYKDLSAALRFPGARVVSTRWNAASRVDHIKSTGIRSLPGLSFAFGGDPPRQDGLTFDGDDLSPVPRVELYDAPFVPYLLTTLPFELHSAGMPHSAEMPRSNADVLILEPRGGLDVFVALANGAQRVVAVEPSELAVEAAGGVYSDPRVQVIIEEPRAFVERSTQQFDVVVLSLTAPYRPVSSGAYSLAEDYRMTVEAFERYLARLRPGGLLAVMRWLQTPPSEEVRLLALAAEAVRRSGGDPAQSIVMLRSYSNALVLVKGSANAGSANAGGGNATAAPAEGFTSSELTAIRAFAQNRRFDLVAAPGLQPGEANRYNMLPDDTYHPLAMSLLNTSDPSAIYAAYPFEIAPPVDDHPFFAHFFKWSQAPHVLATLGKTWQPFGGAGYFVLIVLLILAAFGAFVLIVAPLAVRRNRNGAPRATPLYPPLVRGDHDLYLPPLVRGDHDLYLPPLVRGDHERYLPPLVRGDKGGLRVWTLLYFGLLGIGFLFVEIPLVQQYILLMGRPAAALAVVLFTLLVASGLGSLYSDRLPWRTGAVILTATIALYPSLIRLVTGAILHMPLETRLIVGGLLLAPLGFLMGTMFPRGIAHLKANAPGWIPWAWGINGAASVISSIASAVLALTFGFTWVIACGAVCYGVCALLVNGTNITLPRLWATSSPDALATKRHSV